MSTKDNFLNSLGVDSTEVIDANTLLENFNLGQDLDLEPVEEPVAPPATKLETDDELNDDDSAKFIEDTDDVLSLLETLEDDERPTKDSKTNEPAPKKVELKDEKSDEEINYFEIMAKNLSKIGVFDSSSDDDEDEGEVEWNEETFVKKFEQSSKKMANNLIEEAFGKFGDKQADFLWKVAMEGVDPESYFKAMRSQEVIESFDISTETNQERIMYEYLRMLDPERTHDELIEEISDLKELNKLDKKAEVAKTKLTKYFEAKQQEEVQRAQYESQQKERAKLEFKTTIESAINEAIEKGGIDNIPFTQNDSKELIQYMTDTPYKTADGKLVTELYKDFVEAQQDPTKLLKLAKFLKSGLKIDSAIKKAVNKTKEDLWNFGLGSKSKSSNKGRGGFLD